MVLRCSGSKIAGMGFGGWGFLCGGLDSGMGLDAKVRYLC